MLDIMLTWPLPPSFIFTSNYLPDPSKRLGARVLANCVEHGGEGGWDTPRCCAGHKPGTGAALRDCLFSSNIHSVALSWQSISPPRGHLRSGQLIPLKGCGFLPLSAAMSGLRVTWMSTCSAPRWLLTPDAGKPVPALEPEEHNHLLIHFSTAFSLANLC